MSGRPRRVLVVGAAGMLGREICRAVDGEIVCAGRAARAGWIRFDAETEPVERLLAAAGKVDVVVNCAAALASEIDPADEASVRRAVAVNQRFPGALANATTARVVHISTDAVFRADAGRCVEDGDAFADDVYGTTKRRGEPDAPSALTLRCSFVGLDPGRRRGLLEWLLARPRGAEVSGFVDQAWNGLASTQIAAVVAALADPELFDRARAEGGVHHLFEDPPLSKHELVVLCAQRLGLDIRAVPARSGLPVTRVLATRHRVLREYLESVPPRAESLVALAERGLNR